MADLTDYKVAILQRFVIVIYNINIALLFNRGVSAKIITIKSNRPHAHTTLFAIKLAKKKINNVEPNARVISQLSVSI